MEADPTRMCELLVGLGDVDLVGINDPGEEAPLEVVIRSRKARPVCEACGGPVWSKGYRSVVLVDLPAFGRPVRLGWRKRRWTCPNTDCEIRSFVEQDPAIGPQRALLTSRAARWATVQVGRRGRPVDEVAAELGCDWHTVNNRQAEPLTHNRWSGDRTGFATRLGAATPCYLAVRRCGQRTSLPLGARPAADSGYPSGGLTSLGGSGCVGVGRGSGGSSGRSGCRWIGAPCNCRWRSGGRGDMWVVGGLWGGGLWP